MVKTIGYSKVVLWLLILFVSGQCATYHNSVTSDEFARPLKDIRKAVYFALKAKVKNKSENGRTYFSTYHRPGKDIRLSAYKQKERAQVAITLLGDRRPYRIAVLYRIDKLTSKGYSFNRYDKRLAEEYLSKAVQYLVSRPEERDIIDDFRPY